VAKLDKETKQAVKLSEYLIAQNGQEENSINLF
jgi:hypothetical protein